MKWSLTFLLTLAVVVPSALPAAVLAQEPEEPQRRLRILEPKKAERLDPAFEMIMDKIDEDLRFILSSPIRLTPKGTAYTGLTLLGTFFLVNEDDEYLDDVVSTRDQDSDDLYDRFRVLSRSVPETTAGLYLLGYFLDDTGLKSRALEALEAEALAALITAGSGYLIGHKGPKDSTESDQFEPFNRYRSMPDMSSSLVFSMAGVFAYERPFLEGLLYYGIAAGTALSRVYFEEAWPSDIFLGAVLGTVIGRTVATRSRTKGGDGDITLVPVLELDGRSAVGLKVEFKL